MLRRLTFLSVLALVVLVWGLPVMADEQTADRAEGIEPSGGTKTPGDILWNCDVETIPGDNHILGIETFRDTIYITGGAASTDPNKVHVWTRSGSTCNYHYSVDQVSNPGWGWRDIACDGEYLYASDSRTLQCFYVTPGGVVTVPANDITITGMDDINVIRAVAYDPNNDWFWTADFYSNIYAFDRNGDMVSGPHANTYPVYGMAFHATTAEGGPWLWVHSQDNVKVYQFDVTPGQEGYTGVAYAGYGDGTGWIAGGLCVLEGDPSKDKGMVTLLGIIQGSPDKMYAMEISKYGIYWKPGYEDYAPNGMPDIDQRQNAWYSWEQPWIWTFCGPCAVANCFKWFDSKYNVPPGVPGDMMDQFPLVRDYTDMLPPLWGLLWDDHTPDNVDHPSTGWNPGVPPPPPTPQPFVPGPQPIGVMPEWGELVERLAWFFDTDGIQTGYLNHMGTNILQMQQGIDEWFNSEFFLDGSTLADTLCEVTTPMPTFAYVESLIHKCEDVILLLGFWFENPPGSGEWWRIGGHYVTVAGVNSEDFMIAFSDPFIDFAEMGWPGRVGDGSIIPHPHGFHDPTYHNDEGNVSHDIYFADLNSESPGGVWWIPEYAIMSWDPYEWSENFYAQNVPEEFEPVTAPWNGDSYIHTEVEYCVHISPWDYRGDVNVPGGDGQVSVDDVAFLIAYLYRGGPDPWSFVEGDANCDGEVEVGDIVVLISYLFRYGPVPRCCDP